MRKLFCSHKLIKTFYFRNKDMKVNGTVIPKGTIVRSFLTEILKGEEWSEGKGRREEWSGRGEEER